MCRVQTLLRRVVNALIFVMWCWLSAWGSLYAA